MKIGKFPTYTVEKMIALGRETELLYLYYNYTTIDYIDEVKDMLKIKGDFIVEKPGANKGMFLPMLKENFSRLYKQRTKGRDRTGSDCLIKETRTPSKGYLQSRNR